MLLSVAAVGDDDDDDDEDDDDDDEVVMVGAAAVIVRRLEVLLCLVIISANVTNFDIFVCNARQETLLDQGFVGVKSELSQIKSELNRC